MSARSRGRANPNQDADEERRLWKEIKSKADDVDSMFARSNDIGNEIVQVESQQAALLEAGKPSDAQLDERLERLYRENVKLCEDVQQIIDGNSNEMNLLDSIDVLAGLREASEESAAALQSSQGPRAASGKLGRGPKKGGGKLASSIVASTEDGDSTSAAPSPRINLGGPANRLNAKEKSSRSGSIATTRETSVKVEDGAESVTSSADGASTSAGPTKTSAGNRPTNRLVLNKGETVFCRHDSKMIDLMKKKEPSYGEGILCRVTAVIGEGKQRRYEVQDADPEARPSVPQRASIQQLIKVPETNKGLCDLPRGKHVLGQYPETTTFYKAVVAEPWKAQDTESTEQNNLVHLAFQDDHKPVQEVERRFVLMEK